MRRTLLVLFLLTSFSMPMTPAAQRRDPQFGERRNQEDPDAVRMEKERLKRINKDRHDRIKQDTDKLLDMATELKKYVDESNENMLSLEVIKKAEEIERLAKSVKEKMKG